MPDFTELKQRHAAMWSNGPFEDVADTLTDMHTALVGGQQLGVGEGGSKKAAEQEAAREALAAVGSSG